MGEILLSKLIEQTKESICSLEHSQSTLYQYNLGWRKITEYFHEYNQVMFSKTLAEQYVFELQEKYDTGLLHKWRYKLYRRTTRMLIEVYEHGHFIWKYQKHASSTHIYESAFIFLHNEYINSLTQEGKSVSTVQLYDIVSRQFLEYLELKKIKNISAVQLNDVSLFVPHISKQYQPTSMRTVLTALRSLLRFVEKRKLTTLHLLAAVPTGFGKVTKIVPTFTLEEEQKLLKSVDTITPSGKRNYAMLLLALRTGLRSIDITNLKLSDIKWRNNIIEIVQGKTGSSLVLPLLTDVGNAIADYILNGRPNSSEPYVFLRSQAPYHKLSGHSNCFAISCKMMKAAGIRQGIDVRKGFHCFRHSVAARLLSENTPLPIISSILGHKDKDSTKVYLSTDFKHLRACALSLEGIEVAKEVLR
jgi:integrase